MTSDNYAPCPCGSGKKMKFCKCVDQPQEYEKIMRLIEAGQELAALDRINQLLAKTPSAAWLLALKSELALGLDELDTFKETALRFAKLKPDNPLALVMRSVVSLMDQDPVENSARYLLEGLAESRESLPGLVLTALQLLANTLTHSQKAPFRFFWVQLLLELQSKTEQEAQPPEAATDGSLLTMSASLLLPDPPGAAWSERLKEVLSLKSAFRYAQAETKLRAILRDYPDRPGPLSHLLTAQCVLLDQDGAVATARKLAAHRELSTNDRDYFAALALELEPRTPSLMVPALFKYCEISSEEEASQKLVGLEFIESIPDEFSQNMRQLYAASLQDEVPAKVAFNVLSVVKETGDDKRIYGAVGSVLLFGRQTDKPPRALVTLYNLPGHRDYFDKVVNVLGVVKDLPDPAQTRQHHYHHILERGRFRRESDGRVSMLSIADQSPLMAEDFLSTTFATLDNRTLLEAVEDEPKRAAVRAILTHLEAAHTILFQFGTIEGVYERLQLDRPLFDLGAEGEEARPRTLLDIVRVDIPNLRDQALFGLFGTVISLDIKRASYQLATEILARPSSNPPEAARSAALEILSGVASNLDEALGLLEQLEQSLIRQQKSAGRIILQRMNLLASSGRSDESRAVIEKALREHADDPYIMSFVQYLSQQMQAARGGGAINDAQLMARLGRHGSEPDDVAESPSGLVLPGQESGGGGSKSKLWLPGT